MQQLLPSMDRNDKVRTDQTCRSNAFINVKVLHAAFLIFVTIIAAKSVSIKTSLFDDGFPSSDLAIAMVIFTAS